MRLEFQEFENCFFHEASNHPKVKAKDFTDNIKRINSSIDVAKSFVYSSVMLIDHTNVDKAVYVDSDGERIYISKFLQPTGTKFGDMLCAGRVYLGPKSFKLNDSDVISRPNILSDIFRFNEDEDGKPLQVETEKPEDKNTWKLPDGVRMLTYKEWNAVLELYSNVFGLNWNLQPIDKEDMYFSAVTSIGVPDVGFVEWDDNHVYDKEFMFLCNYMVKSDVKSLFGGAKVVSTKDYKLKDYLVPLKLLRSTEGRK